MITEYNSIGELVSVFEEYWLPYKVGSVGRSESGIEIQYMVDKKSESLYLEQYSTTLNTMSVHSFRKGEYPEVWCLEGDVPTYMNMEFFEY